MRLCFLGGAIPVIKFCKKERAHYLSEVFEKTITLIIIKTERICLKEF